MDETSRRYKVMRLIARLNIGGPAIHTTLLTERLNPQIFESKLVTGLEAGHEGNMLDLMGNTAVRPLIIPSLGREISPSNDLRTLYQVARLMRQYKPDIVHTHTAKAGFVGRMAARLAHVPIIVHTFHGNVFRGYFSPKKTKLFIDIEKFLAGFTDRIIVLSDQQRQEILSLGIGKADQYQIIPLGLNLTPFLEADTLRGQLRAELKVGPDVPLVGIVARLVPIKAIHFFIEAAKRVLETHPQALFLIVGDGELRAELEAQAKSLGVDKSVKFMGFRGDLPRIYADLDCSVLCSLNEGLPVAVIEALSAARPVVATDVGGVKDLIGANETGWLVPAQNVEALAQAVHEALANPALATQRAQAGRGHVYPSLDIKRLVGDIETLYLDLLRKKGILNKG